MSSRRGAALPEHRPLPPPDYPVFVAALNWLAAAGTFALLCEIAYNIGSAL